MKCLVIDDDETVCMCLGKLISETDFLTLSGTFSDPQKAAGYIMTHNDIDLIFLDVEMPGISGMELLASLGDALNNIIVIIVSSKEKYALDAFENNVTSYILKPLTTSSFLKAVNKANKFFTERNNNNLVNEKSFFVRSNDGKYIKIKANDIYWIEVCRNNIQINTYDAQYTITATLKEFSSELPDNVFLKTHRSFIVNANKIEMFDMHEIILETSTGKVTIPISRNFRHEMLNGISVFGKEE